MIDFLNAHPGVTRDEYLWGWSVPQVRLAIYDNTHVEYLSEEQAKIEKKRRHTTVHTDISSLVSDLGIPIFK